MCLLGWLAIDVSVCGLLLMAATTGGRKTGVVVGAHAQTLSAHQTHCSHPRTHPHTNWYQRRYAAVCCCCVGVFAAHIRRRFYPLYPPPLGTCLDLTGDAALQLHTLPHLLLLPSDLAPFAKAVAASAATEAGGTYQQPPAAAAETAGTGV